jgi:hypothetical protein
LLNALVKPIKWIRPWMRSNSAKMYLVILSIVEYSKNLKQFSKGFKL